MPQLERQRLRIAGNPLSFEQPKNVLTRGSGKLWSGSAAQVEVALFDGASLSDIANLSFVTFEIKEPVGNAAPAPSATPLVQKILAAGALNGTLTLEQWTAGAAENCHAFFELSDAETSFAGQRWVLCYATTLLGNTVTLFAGLMEFVQDGGPSTTAPDPVVEDAWTKAEADARYVRPGTAEETLMLKAPDGSEWEISITNDGQIERTKL